MRTVDFTLKAYLDQHGLTAYRLAKASRGRLSRGTVYALARGGVARVDLGTLGTVLTVLEELTGQEVTPGELLEVSIRPGPEVEAQEWATAELTPALPPYDWGEAGEPGGEPVHYLPGVDFQIGKA